MQQRLWVSKSMDKLAAILTTGTSKWRRIEHCRTMKNWSGRALTDRIAVVELVSAATTEARLKVKRALDERTCGKVSGPNGENGCPRPHRRCVPIWNGTTQSNNRTAPVRGIVAVASDLPSRPPFGTRLLALARAKSRYSRTAS